MNIVQAHNHQVAHGGSAVAFRSVVDLLRAHGHDVTTVERHNGAIAGLPAKLRAAGQSVYCAAAKAELAGILRRRDIDVAHAHSLFPLLSPSILDACAEAGVPAVLSVHDFKATCPTSQHFRDGAPCERCLGGREYWCALTNCRGSLAMSAAYALSSALIRRSRRLHERVAAYLPPSAFVARQMIKAGFPAERITVVPNMADLPGDGPATPGAGRYVAFAGRISPEKGVGTLLEAARITGLPVRVAGDTGKMPHLVAQAPANVAFLGALGRERLAAFYAGARFLVVPSVCYEAFGLVAAEAMALGLPVIASRIGGLPEVVDHGVTGLLFEPGDAADLARQMRTLWDAPELAARLGHEGRRKARREYGRDACYARLMAVYRRVAAGRRSCGRAA